jgi:hypothetical protein
MHTSATRRAFPAMPPQILDLMEDGDLQRVIPGWIELFSGLYDEQSSAHAPEQRLRLAWLAVLAVYDARVADRRDTER